MGCIYSKVPSHNDFQKNVQHKPSSKGSWTSSRKEGGEVSHMGNDTPKHSISKESLKRNSDSTSKESLKRNSDSTRGDEGEKKPLVIEKSKVQPPMSRVFSIQNGVDGAQVVAGWPWWLTSVAGEAIKGWIPRKADSFEKLDKIGQGTYSSVYRARDLEKGKIVALKKVRFVNMDPESVGFMAREILVLRRLDHPNVMKLEGLVTSRVSGNFYFIFEYMEHDLAGLAASPDIKFTEPQIKCFMKQLLCGLEHCHNRGVLHRDIKASNLLVDDNGNLKIADFGLATFYRANQKQAMTSRVVTLWYRPPELLLGSTNYGVAVDLWSSGCILAELFAGKPVMLGRTEIEQLHKIYKLCGSPPEDYWKNSKLPHETIFKPQQPYKRTLAETHKDFPPSTLTLLDSLLAFEPELRGTTTSALQSKFFTSTPLPCDPSSLPKYPPSKEYDAKLRDYKQRKIAEAGNNSKLESNSKDEQKSRAKAAPNASAALLTSIQKGPERVEEIRKSNTEHYNLEADRCSVSHNEPPRKALLKRLNQYGGSTHVPNDAPEINYSRFSADLRSHRSFKFKGVAAARLSKFSSSVANHNASQFDLSREGNRYKHWPRESPSFLGRPKDNFLQRDEDTSGIAPEKTPIHFHHHHTTRKRLKAQKEKFQRAVRKTWFLKDKKTKTKTKTEDKRKNIAPLASFPFRT